MLFALLLLNETVILLSLLESIGNEVKFQFGVINVMKLLVLGEEDRGFNCE